MAGSCISEPDAGSDITSIGTRATSIDGDRMVVNGSKVWSSHASIADVLLVAVSGGKDERGRSIVSRLLVDTRETDPSSIITRDLEMIGLKRHHLCEVTFVDCVVPRDNLVGDEGDGVKMFPCRGSQRAVLGVSSQHLSRRPCPSVSTTKQRRQFGRAIGVPAHPGTWSTWRRWSRRPATSALRRCTCSTGPAARSSRRW
jgi:alkylation response protein AidB-like acyl-CoA dehydrogenase